MKRLFTACFAFVCLLSLVLPVSASSDFSLPSETDKPAYQLIDNTSFIDENGEIQYFCTECPQSRHSSLLLHTHHVTNVSAPYEVSVYAGVVIEQTTPSKGGERLSGEISATVSNSYSTNLGFSSDTVSSAVGYSVTASFTKTGSISVPLSEGQTGRIVYYNVYNRTNFTTLTKYYTLVDDQAVFAYDETDSGYALQWSHFRIEPIIYG